MKMDTEMFRAQERARNLISKRLYRKENMMRLKAANALPAARAARERYEKSPKGIAARARANARARARKALGELA